MANWVHYMAKSVTSTPEKARRQGGAVKKKQDCWVYIYSFSPTDPVLKFLGFFVLANSSALCFHLLLFFFLKGNFLNSGENNMCSSIQEAKFDSIAICWGVF